MTSRQHAAAPRARKLTSSLRVHTLAFTALFLGFSSAACADEGVETPNEEPATLAAGKADGVDHDNWTFFRATRHDYRRCIHPLCGGVYVARVNQPKTKCLDGAWAKDCYVSEFDFSPMGISGDKAHELNQLARDGQLVVRGEIKGGAYPDFPEVAVFAVTEAWKAATDRAPTGIFYRAHDLGIMCITWPCVSTELTRLNRNANPVSRAAGVDLTRSGASDDQIADAWQRMYDDAIVFAGKLEKVRGPAGTADTVIASQFYVRVISGAAVGQACGSRGLAPCPEGMFCEFADEWCGAADVPGTCQIRPEVCTKEYFPVCGCDGVTYGNDCMRQMAGVGFGTEGECKVGPGCQIGGCGSELCLSADEEAPMTICLARPEHECYQQFGVCEDTGRGCSWTMSAELESCLSAASGGGFQQSF